MGSAPAAQNGMEKAAANRLPVARAEAVQTPMPTFQVTAKPARPTLSADAKEAGGMSMRSVSRSSRTLARAPGGWIPSLQPNAVGCVRGGVSHSSGCNDERSVIHVQPVKHPWTA